MRLPESRQATHSPVSTTAWAHQPFQPFVPHNHVIPERETPERKSQLGEHIDMFHRPDDASLSGEGPSAKA